MNSRITFLLSAVLAAMATMTFPAAAQKSGNTITVKGSDTLVNLSASWAEAFMEKNPGIAISVTGGGSGVGIAALLNGTTDICNASRDVKPEEKKKGSEAGVNVNEINVALDGIAIVVNPGNPLKEITLEQLRQIYTGQLKSWKDLNGQDARVIVLSRETSSGTYVFFQEHVLQKQDYSPSVMMMPATSAIIESVAADKGAIGYVGLGYAAQASERVKVLPVKKDPASPAIAPDEETVRSGKYPIARPLHCYTNGAPTGNVKAFLDFCLGEEGQKIVREEGFVPMKGTTK